MGLVVETFQWNVSMEVDKIYKLDNNLNVKNTLISFNQFVDIINI